MSTESDRTATILVLAKAPMPGQVKTRLQARFALDQAAAPGVSAPAAGGLSTHVWLYAAYRAGQ